MILMNHFLKHLKTESRHNNRFKNDAQKNARLLSEALYFSRVIHMFGIFRKSINHKNLWEEHLQSIEPGSEQDRELRPVIERFFMPDNIDFNKFIANYQLLTDEHTLTSCPTKSTRGFQRRENRPIGYPIWFLASYPDVASWFTQLFIEDIHSAEKTYEAVFGKYDEAALENEFLDQESQMIKTQYLRTLINYYLANVKRKLECAG